MAVGKGGRAAFPVRVPVTDDAGRRYVLSAVIQPGRMLYEIEGIPEATAREAFRLAAAKLSVQTTFVVRTVR